MVSNLLKLFIESVSNKNKIYVRGLNNSIIYLVKAAKEKRIKTKELEKQMGIREQLVVHTRISII